MKAILAACLLSLALVGSVRDTSADVGLRWNQCASPVVNANVEPYSAGPHDLIVTISGYELDANEIDLTLAVYDPCYGDGRFVPEAWRFDAAGCQAGRLTVDRPASFDGCDGLVPLTSSLETVTASEIHTTVGQNHPVTYATIFIRIAQSFATRHLVASERYVVARVRLDMSNTAAEAAPEGGACGCGSSPRQIAFVSGMLNGPAGGGPITSQGYVEDLAFWVAPDYCVIDKPAPPLTMGNADPTCLTTAARASTWGAIKGQYR